MKSKSSSAADTWLQPAQAPDREAFIDISNNRLLLRYLRQVEQAFMYADNFGLALDDDDRVQGKPVFLANLFVLPHLDEKHWLPEQLIQAEAQKEIPEWRQVEELFRANPRLFVLGDPGTGKTTLIRWLMLSFTATGSSAPQRALGSLVPCAFILRELDLREVKDWDSLWQAFLTQGGPLTAPLRESPATADKLLTDGQALLLFDGLDEITAPEIRRRLGQAVREGMNRHPRCRFLITSRLVGFEQGHWLGIDSADREGAETAEPYKDHEQALLSSGKQTEANAFQALPVYYLTPFEREQVARFVHNWQSQYLTENQRRHLPELIQRLTHNDGLGRLARIPVLLNMICFIHARRGRLPEGRAELYQRVAETYLSALDRARNLKFQGREIGFDYRDLSNWLGRLAYQVQESRDQEEIKNDALEQRALLIPETQVLNCLREGLEEEGFASEEVEQEARFILAYLGQRSGLLLPRGRLGGGRNEEEHYAFAHLSLQEYFAAVELQTRERFLSEEEWKTLRRRACRPAWRETLVLWFEGLDDPRLSRQNLKQLFGEPGRPASLLSSEEDAAPAWALLAEIVMDSAVRLPSQSRQDWLPEIWDFYLSHDWSMSKHADSFARLIGLLWTPEFSSLHVFQARASEITKLSLTPAAVSELSLLAGLSNLRWLNLSGTAVSELSPLAGLSNLRWLNLNGTAVSKLSPLAELSNLQVLNLNGTAVSELSPLAELSNLRYLDLSGTAVSEFSPLAELSNLEVLVLRSTAVSELSPLAGLSNLKVLDLSDTAVSELSPLAGLNNLETLYLSGKAVSELLPLAGLSNLRYLDLSGTAVSELSPLAGLSNLRQLDLSGTAVSELSPLAGLSNLRSLNLNGTEVRELSPLAGLSNLGRLDLSGTAVSELSPLAELSNLETLDLSGTAVRELSPLAGLSNLEKLDLR